MPFFLELVQCRRCAESHSYIQHVRRATRQYEEQVLSNSPLRKAARCCRFGQRIQRHSIGKCEHQRPRAIATFLDLGS